MADACFDADRKFAADEELRDLAERYGTPLMVYDRETLLSRVRLLQEAFGWNPGYRQFFPVKEICNPHLLRLLLEAGCGLLCSNANTLRAAQLAGAKPEDLLFTACFPSEADWQATAMSGAAVILDSPDQLTHVSPEHTRALGLRVQPEGAIPFSGIPGSSRYTKFGMTRQELLDTAVRAARMGFSSVGLHMQAGSNLQIPGYYAAAAWFLLELSREVARRLPVRWCDLGGGLAVGCDIAREVRLVSEVIPGDMPIYTELGRFLAAPAGILLTRVLGIKRQAFTTVGIDASMAELPRMCLPGVRYHVSLLGAAREQMRVTYHLAGPIMDRIDTFSGRFVLPKVKEGSILAFHDVGVNSCSMASNYGGALRCAQVLLEQNGPKLICPRQTQAQWLESCGF